VKPETQHDLTLEDLYRVFRRRSKIVSGAILSVFGLAVLFCSLVTPYYESTATIQVQKESTDGLGLDSLMGAADSTSDALEANINIQTQASILQSDNLALQTIQNLQLEKTKEFSPRFNIIGWAFDLLSREGSKDPVGVGLDASPNRRAHALKIFSKNLSVKPVSGTRLIELKYLSSDPKVSAAVVNALSKELVGYNFKTRYEATQQVSGWLEDELNGLRSSSEQLQTQVAQMQRDAGVYSLGSIDAIGREQSYSTILDSLQQATAALNVAEQNRILKGAIYQVTRSGNAELISGLAGTSLAAGASGGLNNSLFVVQNLRSQEAALQEEIQQMKEKFGSAYPKISELQAELAGLQRSIADEVKRVAERAENDYRIAQQTEAGLRHVYESQKVEADKLNNKAIKYLLTRQEAASSRGLYEDMSKHLKEAGVLEGLHTSNITVVDEGRVPAKPVSPNVPLYLILALLAGGSIGAIVAYAADLVDNKIQSPEEVEALGFPLLGIMPKNDSLVSDHAFPLVEDRKGAYSESVRTLAAQLLLAKGGEIPKVILVTSATSNEGKSSLSRNLAASYAQQGKTVLLVETDMRRPNLGRRLRVGRNGGLSELLTSGTVRFTHEASLPNLSILLAGPIPPYPAELIGSQALRNAMASWRAQFDLIVLDAPPVLPVVDSLILSELSDTVVVVVRHALTTRISLKRTDALLRAHASGSIGMVMNALDAKSDAYYTYYGYSGTGYYGSEGEHEIN
jgi:succinoglycan biosynthesis transport protein ExoP